MDAESVRLNCIKASIDAAKMLCNGLNVHDIIKNAAEFERFVLGSYNKESKKTRSNNRKTG